jgi:hypothetical protein
MGRTHASSRFRTNAAFAIPRCLHPQWSSSARIAVLWQQPARGRSFFPSPAAAQGSLHKDCRVRFWRVSRFWRSIGATMRRLPENGIFAGCGALVAPALRVETNRRRAATATQATGMVITVTARGLRRWIWAGTTGLAYAAVGASRAGTQLHHLLSSLRRDLQPRLRCRAGTLAVRKQRVMQRRLTSHPLTRHLLTMQRQPTVPIVPTVLQHSMRSPRQESRVSGLRPRWRSLSATQQPRAKTLTAQPRARKLTAHQRSLFLQRTLQDSAASGTAGVREQRAGTAGTGKDDGSAGGAGRFPLPYQQRLLMCRRNCSKEDLLTELQQQARPG